MMNENNDRFAVGCLGLAVIVAVFIICWFVLVAVGMWIIR